jgi:nucleoside-diphosphate-sugar epimerase
MSVSLTHQRENSKLSLSVLVTGGSGFVGKPVVAELARRGHQVYATTTKQSPSLPQSENVIWREWHASTGPLPEIDWNRLDVILHLAAPAGQFEFPEQARLLYELGIASTFRFLELARRKGVKRLLFASTGDVLDTRERPAREDNVLYLPRSFYGTVKACGELLLRSYQSIISTAILRLYHPYGPGGERFLVHRLIESVRDGREIRLQGRDGVSLNPVWIEDVAVGLCSAVESSATGIFHFAGPDHVSLRALAEIIGEIANKKPVFRVEDSVAPGGHEGAFERTQRCLNYTPQVSLREGLARIMRPEDGRGKKTETLNDREARDYSRR